MKILWDLKILWEMGSRRAKILQDIVSQCEVWHVCTLISTRSRFGLLCSIFCKFTTQLDPWLLLKFRFHLGFFFWIFVLYMHCYWTDRGWNYYTWIFCILQLSYGPGFFFFFPEFCFCPISSEWIDGKWSDFDCLICLCRFESIYISFYKFTAELWPLVIIRIFWFLLNILWTNWWNLIKFCICMAFMRSRLGLLCIDFCKFTTELWPLIIIKILFLLNNMRICASLGGSVGCAVQLETRRSRVQPPPRLATFFRGDWSWNIFYGHSLPSADSRRAVVSFWRKNVHNTG